MTSLDRLPRTYIFCSLLAYNVRGERHPQLGEGVTSCGSFGVDPIVELISPLESPSFS